MGPAGAPPPELSDAADAVARLLKAVGCAADGGTWVPLTGGINNTVLLYREGARELVLKRYPRDPAQRRNRMNAEVGFLRYAADAAPDYTPGLIASDVTAGLAILSYIGGEAARVTDLNATTISGAGSFLAALNAPAHRQAARRLGPATDAEFSVAGHVALIEDRLKELDRDAEPTPATAAQARVAMDALRRQWDAVRTLLLDAVAKGTLDGELAEADRVVSPSDFGFHNARFDRAGKLRFFDFEYAGWDDPAKTLADFFLQPRIPVNLSWWTTFVDAGPSLRPALIHRVRLMTPLFAVKWACIILRSLIPTYRSRRMRIHPGTSADALLAAQMALAIDMLARGGALPRP